MTDSATAEVTKLLQQEFSTIQSEILTYVYAHLLFSLQIYH